MYKSHICRTWYYLGGHIPISPTHTKCPLQCKHSNFAQSKVGQLAVCNPAQEYVLWLYISANQNTWISSAIFSMTLNFRLSHAYSVLSSQVSGENIYILRLPNIHHKEKEHFPLSAHEKEIKKRTHKYMKFYWEQSILDTVKNFFKFHGYENQTKHFLRMFLTQF